MRDHFEHKNYGTNYEKNHSDAYNKIIVKTDSIGKIGFFSEKKYNYSSTESCIHDCLPYCGCTRDKLREAVSEGKFLIDEPLLAFRGDSRKPDEIFSSGFSAYAFQRMEMCPACGSCDLDIINCNNCISLMWCLCPTLLTCGIPLLLQNIACCLIFGNSTYERPFNSRWPALALTKYFSDANQGLGAYSDFEYRYLVCMDGAVDFSAFSNGLVASGPDPRGSLKMPWLRDENEIFPKDLDDQTIDGSHIIACVVPNKNPDDVRHYTTIAFNPEFQKFEIIKDKIKDIIAGRGELELSDGHNIQVKIEDNYSIKFFEEIANKLDIKYMSESASTDISAKWHM